jgi:hypothetical protein
MKEGDEVTLWRAELVERAYQDQFDRWHPAYVVREERRVVVGSTADVNRGTDDAWTKFYAVDSKGVAYQNHMAPGLGEWWTATDGSRNWRRPECISIYGDPEPVITQDGRRAEPGKV